MESGCVNVKFKGDGLRLRESVLFLGRFLRNPRRVGSIAPSSRYLAREMVSGIDRSPGVRVVEFGPGTGAFTAALDRALPAGGSYLGIERDPVFVDVLRRRFPRFDYACASVEDLVTIAGERGLLPIDHIVSGLPFASLPAGVTLPILDATRASLRDGGTFRTFQYVHAYRLPAARTFRKEMERRFGPPFSRSVVYRNIPPAFILSWRK